MKLKKLFIIIFSILTNCSWQSYSQEIIGRYRDTINRYNKALENAATAEGDNKSLREFLRIAYHYLITLAKLQDQFPLENNAPLKAYLSTKRLIGIEGTIDSIDGQELVKNYLTELGKLAEQIRARLEAVKKALKEGAYQNYLKKYAMTAPETKKIRELWPHMPAGLPELIVEFNCITPKQWEENNEKFIKALTDKNIPLLKDLINSGAVDISNTKVGSTPALLFAIKEVPEIAKLMIEKDVDINVKDDNGKNALMKSLNDPEIAKLLINKGIDIHARDNYEFTALILFADTDHEDIIKLLLERGADVNDNNGETPLINAVRNQFPDPNPNIIRLLLSYKPDVNARDINGYTALHYAREPEIIKLLKDAGATE